MKKTMVTTARCWDRISLRYLYYGGLDHSYFLFASSYAFVAGFLGIVI
jgi:hypothetical protein